MKDSFNSNFYITAATVIPLLYITLFLQGQMTQNLVRRFHDLSDRIDKVFEDWSTNGRTWISRSTAPIVRYLYEAVGGLLAVVIMVLPLAGIAAEGFSLWALYYQADNNTMREVVLWSMLGLLILVSANPTIAITRNLWSFDGSDKKPAPSEAEQREEKNSLGHRKMT
jgi:hypothetical protein